MGDDEGEVFGDEKEGEDDGYEEEGEDDGDKDEVEDGDDGEEGEDVYGRFFSQHHNSFYRSHVLDLT